MMKSLLVRGMLAGAEAGVVAFVFAYVFGEPQIDYALAFEEQAAQQAAAAGSQGHEEESVSRAVQSTIGLLTALLVYGAGIGGLFAIAFALAYGRIGSFGPRATAALLAAAGFISVAAVPFLKYPGNPPAIGSPDTLGNRTALFLVMIAISIGAVGLAIGLAQKFFSRFGPQLSLAIALAAFAGIVGTAYVILPDVKEIPEAFSTDALWKFRAASLTMQLLIWLSLGLTFGALSARLLGQGRR